MLGVLAAIMVRNREICFWLRQHTSALYLVAVLSGAPVLVLSFKGWGMMSTAMSTIGYTMIASFYCSILLLAVLAEGPLRELFCMHWLRWLGTIAYGLYMVHSLLLGVAFQVIRHHERNH